MIDKITINKIVDFCIEHDIPNMPSALTMYEHFYNDMYDKFSNKHVVEQEIWSKWKQVYQAYWDPTLKYYLNRYKK